MFNDSNDGIFVGFITIVAAVVSVGDNDRSLCVTVDSSGDWLR